MWRANLKTLDFTYFHKVFRLNNSLSLSAYIIIAVIPRHAAVNGVNLEKKLPPLSPVDPLMIC